MLAGHRLASQETGPIQLQQASPVVNRYLPTCPQLLVVKVYLLLPVCRLGFQINDRSPLS